MKALIINIAFLYFLLPTLKAQIEIDKRIIFTGDQESKRRVQNLAFPADDSAAISAGTIQANKASYGIADGTDSLSLSLTPAIEELREGARFFFKASATNTGPVTLRINSLPAIGIVKDNGKSLKPGDLKQGVIYTIAFNSTSFQLLNVSRSCPNGFIDVNENYCIETDERAASSFFNAVVTCAEMNASLCSWAEWYHACQNSSLGLLKMTNNYEWTDDASNENQYVRMVGVGSCTSGADGLATNSYAFRCCFRK